jgi:hypothetical protein
MIRNYKRANHKIFFAIDDMKKEMSIHGSRIHDRAGTVPTATGIFSTTREPMEDHPTTG